MPSSAMVPLVVVPSRLVTSMSVRFAAVVVDAQRVALTVECVVATEVTA